MLEQRALASRQRRRDPRLKDRVAVADAAGGRIEPRTVEWMRHGADEAIDGAARQASIGIERDHVADISRWLADVREEARVGRAAQQAIELVELPALALPSHPRVLGLIPQPAAVEEKEPLTAARRRTVTPVQAVDRLA